MKSSPETLEFLGFSLAMGALGWDVEGGAAGMEPLLRHPTVTLIVQLCSSIPCAIRN